MEKLGALFRARFDEPEHILMEKFGALRGAREIARCYAENPTHMPRHVALVCETGCLRNLGNGQAAVQQQGSSKFHPALNNELMERYTYGAPKKRPGV
jgi:hypothetical protein